MTVGTTSEIAATEARIKELQALWLETHDSDSATNLLAASLLQKNRAADLEISRRVQLGGAIKTELSGLKTKLTVLKQSTRREFAASLASVLLVAGAFIGAAAGVDALLNKNDNVGARHLAAIFAGYAVLSVAAQGAVNTRWGKGKEAGK